MDLEGDVFYEKKTGNFLLIAALLIVVLGAATGDEEPRGVVKVTVTAAKPVRQPEAVELHFDRERYGFDHGARVGLRQGRDRIHGAYPRR